MNDITERFLIVYDYLLSQSIVGSQAEFAREIEVSNSTITEICKRRTNAGITPIKNIVKRFSQINSNWLLIGEGDMLNKINNNLQEPNNIYTLKTDNNLKDQLIPLYDITATAGVLEIFKNSSKAVPMDHIKIPNLPKCDGAIHITGDSMYPLLKSGDIALYRVVQDKENIIWGEMYLIYINNKGDEFFFCKYIHKSEREGYITLASQNQHHQPVDFPIDSIQQLAIVKASIRINSVI